MAYNRRYIVILNKNMNKIHGWFKNVFCYMMLGRVLFKGHVLFIHGSICGIRNGPKVMSESQRLLIRSLNRRRFSLEFDFLSGLFKFLDVDLYNWLATGYIIY